jgi:hypothetical protein
MRTLYLKQRLARTLPPGCCVVHVSALLRELILHACTVGSLNKTIRWQGHLIHVIVNQLEAIREVPLQLPNPSDPRALRVATAVLDDPSDRRPLTALCTSRGHQQEDSGETISERCRDDVQ